MSNIIATYLIFPNDITSTGTGTITIEDLGFDKRAVANFTDVAKNINISYTGQPNISASPDILAEEAIIELNGQLQPNYGPNYLSLQLVESSTNPEPEVEPEVVPNDGEEEVDVYVVRSSIPTDGPRGQISFEFREIDGQKEIGCLGELFTDTYNTEEFSFPIQGQSAILADKTTMDFDYRGLADSVLETMNNNIKELSGGLEEFGVLEIVETQTEPPQNFYNYTITGKIIDGGNLDPLADVLIEDDVKSAGLVGSLTYSESSGDFVLMGEYQKDKNFTLTFSLEGYQTKANFSPFKNTEDNILILRKDIGIIELNTSQVNKEEIIKEAPLEDLQVKSVAVAEQLKDPQGFFIDAFLQRLVKQLKTQMLPFVLQQLAAFGITNAAAAIGKSPEDLSVICPASMDELKIAIEKKDKLTKQLNNLFESLNTVKDSISFLNQAVTVADVVFQALSAVILAFPSIPFAPDITKFFTSKIPSFPTPSQNKSVQEVIAIVIGKAKIILTSVELVLNILLQLLQKLLTYMALLDSLLEKCATDMGANDLLATQENISLDLLESTQDQALQGNSVVTNISGFEMSVISVDGTTNEQLKRRRAIARNKDGVIMLQGEPSFSSNDQILINELVFYIKQNDLKAN